MICSGKSYFDCCAIFLGINKPDSNHPLFCQWSFGPFPVWAILNHAHSSTCLVGDVNPHFSSEYTQARTIWLKGKGAFSFSKNYQAIFKVPASNFSCPAAVAEVLVALYFHQLFFFFSHCTAFLSVVHVYQGLTALVSGLNLMNMYSSLRLFVCFS